MDVARLWLNGDPTIFNVTGRDTSVVQHVQLDVGRAISDDPLVVLVDENSASASEILAGALRDNGRAKIIGNSPTYGKGKIQNLYELGDGSALFVTVVRTLICRLPYYLNITIIFYYRYQSNEKCSF